MQSTSAIARRQTAGSVMLPSMRRMRSATAARFSRRPVEKSSKTTTSCPPATSCSTKCEPMKPAPPVTKNRMSSPLRWARVLPVAGIRPALPKAWGAWMIVASEQQVFPHDGRGASDAFRRDFLDFTITAVNPLDHEQDIKRLFVTHERPEFPGFFDRAYPHGVRAGGVSWVGRDRAGQVVMHLACFPQRFRFGEREVVGGLMINALVARPYRTFFPAHALIRRAKGDTKVRGDIDFVYTDPNEQAKAVMDMYGFARVGTLTRYVLPVGDRRRLLDGAIRLFHAGVHAVTWSQGVAALVGHPAAEFEPARVEAPSGDSPRLRPYPRSVRDG